MKPSVDAGGEDAFLLDCEGLTKVFPSRGRGGEGVRAVDAVTLGVRAGETLGLVGESGSGKSTLLRIIAGLTDADSGSLRLRGLGLSLEGRKRPRSLRRHIQIVFQNPYGALNPRRTIRQSMLEAWGGVPRRGAKGETAAVDALETVGLGADHLNRLPGELSGGQAQRVSIARSVIAKPDLLLLDEPTSALDVSIQAQILNLLRELQDRLELTYVVVTHDLAAVAVLAHKIAVMKEGEIIEAGSANSVIRNPHKAYTTALIETSLY